MGRIAVVLVLALAGLLFTTSARTADGSDLRSDARDLPGLVLAESRRVQDRAERVEELRAEVDRLAAEVGDRDVRTRTLADRVAPLEQASGTAARAGEGLVVELTDAPRDRPVPDGTPGDFLVVHQQDVEAVVNALWRGGAEAVALQDQRVIATTAFLCVGNTMRLHGRVYSPPYRVTALGDPAALRAALLDDPAVATYLEYVDAYGLGWSVEEGDDLRVPAYEGALDLRYAEVAAKDDEGER